MGYVMSPATVAPAVQAATDSDGTCRVAVGLGEEVFHLCFHRHAVDGEKSS
jgi:hypothetical protein